MTVIWNFGPAAERARFNLKGKTFNLKLKKKNKKKQKATSRKPQASSCDETKCLEKNIGLINGDWLCLDCGEKVKPQASSAMKQTQLKGKIKT